MDPAQFRAVPTYYFFRKNNGYYEQHKIKTKFFVKLYKYWKKKSILERFWICVCRLTRRRPCRKPDPSFFWIRIRNPDSSLPQPKLWFNFKFNWFPNKIKQRGRIPLRAGLRIRSRILKKLGSGSKFFWRVGSGASYLSVPVFVWSYLDSVFSSRGSVPDSFHPNPQKKLFF